MVDVRFGTIQYSSVHVVQICYNDNVYNPRFEMIVYIYGMIDVYSRGNVIGAYFRDIGIVYIEEQVDTAEPAWLSNPRIVRRWDS